MNNELKQVIKYNMPATVYEKFLDIKTEVFNKYKEDNQTGNITLENSSGLNRLIKNIGAEKLKVTDSRIAEIPYEDLINLIKEANEKLGKVIENISIEADDVSTQICVNSNIDAKVDIYVKQQRGNCFSFEMAGLNNFKAMVINSFCAYPSEGFVFSLAIDGCYVSVTPEALSGVKGSGALYIYAIVGGGIYKADETEKIKNAEKIMKIFKG